MLVDLRTPGLRFPRGRSLALLGRGREDGRRDLRLILGIGAAFGGLALLFLSLRDIT